MDGGGGRVEGKPSESLGKQDLEVPTRVDRKQGLHSSEEKEGGGVVLGCEY